MGINRLTRDAILLRALDLVDSAALDAKDRPTPGTISADALSIGWLQQGLDYFHTKFPFGLDRSTSALTFVAGTATYALPDDFIQDYKNGVLLSQDGGRLQRRGLGAILERSAVTRGKPLVYTVTATAGVSKLQVSPIPDQTYTATLYYYAMPAVLGASDTPRFPSDMVLVKYVAACAREWIGAVGLGTAEKYADMVIADLQRQGIGNEDEDDQIPLDPHYYSRRLSSFYDWMGTTVVT